MHAGNARTHQDTAGERSKRIHHPAAHHVQRNGRSDNRRKQ